MIGTKRRPKLHICNAAPVNSQHSLNVGREIWCRITGSSTRFAGKVWYDLMRSSQFAFTGLSRASLIYNSAPGSEGAVYFDRSVLRYAGNTAFTKTISGTFSIGAWCRPDGTSNTYGVFSTRQSSDSSLDLRFSNGSNVNCDIGNGASWIVTGNSISYSYSAGVWVYMLAVFTTTGWTLYINGLSIGSNAYSGTPLLTNATHYPIIGNAGTANSSEQWLGGLDSVSVWSRTLSATEAMQLYLEERAGCPRTLNWIVPTYGPAAGGGGGGGVPRIWQLGMQGDTVSPVAGNIWELCTT